jgi:hypothetical protein
MASEDARNNISSDLNSQANKSLAIVVIPLYKAEFTTSEWASLVRTLSVLAHYPIAIVCPNRLASHFAKASQGWPHKDVRIYPFANHFFSGIAGYNQLLVSRRFYQAFAAYQFMLIAQTDALILSDQLAHWCERNYSYIGAPFFAGFAKPEKPLRIIGIGNGGVSLRRISDFLQTLDRARYLPNFLAPQPKSLFDIGTIARFIRHRFIFAFNFWPCFPKVNEDVFWGLLMPKSAPFFTVAPISEAVAFAFDNEPQYLYEQNGHKLPFACHAWERFDLPFWQKTLAHYGIDLSCAPIPTNSDSPLDGVAQTDRPGERA